MSGFKSALAMVAGLSALAVIDLILKKRWIATFFILRSKLWPNVQRVKVLTEKQRIWFVKHVDATMVLLKQYMTGIGLISLVDLGSIAHVALARKQPSKYRIMRILLMEEKTQSVSLRICDCGHFPGSHYHDVCLSLGCNCTQYVEQVYYS